MSAAEPLPFNGPSKRPATPPKKRTEPEMLAMLRERHVRPGNGGAGEYAFMTHVRNAAGFNANRTMDAVVMSLWPSRGLELHAYEVKCSRSDWLRELKEPAKAEAAAKLCDRFSLVIGDDSIVQPGELPPTWGLLVARGSKLVCVKEAPLLPDADPKRPVGRSFLVSLLRAGGAVPVAEAEEVRAARAEGHRQGREGAEATVQVHKETADQLRRTIRAFESSAGISLTGYLSDNERAAEIGAAVRSIIDGEKRAEQAQTRLRNVQGDLRRAADELDRFLA